MIQSILEDKIEAAGIATPGVDLFRSFMPSDITTGVMTRIPLSGISVDHYIPGWHKTDIQVIVRHTDPVDGAVLARSVTKALEMQGEERYPANEERGDLKLTLFVPETLPIEFPRLDGGGLEWSQTFKTVFSFVSL